MFYTLVGAAGDRSGALCAGGQFVLEARGRRREPRVGGGPQRTEVVDEPGTDRTMRMWADSPARSPHSRVPRRRSHACGTMAQGQPQRPRRRSRRPGGCRHAPRESAETAAGRLRDAVADVVLDFPVVRAWAALGEVAHDDVEAYACFRVGYHRGLDALRRAGWKGSGFVRWSHPGNRGFLRSVDGLRAAAAAIGETAEEERCALFLRQLDPAWSPQGHPGPGDR